MVQYLPKNYTTASVIREAISDLHSIRQGKKETEIEFISRLNRASYSCGNLFNDVDEVEMYVDALLLQILTVVDRYRGDQPRASLTF